MFPEPISNQIAKSSIKTIVSNSLNNLSIEQLKEVQTFVKELKEKSSH